MVRKIKHKVMISIYDLYNKYVTSMMVSIYGPCSRSSRGACMYGYKSREKS